MKAVVAALLIGTAAIAAPRPAMLWLAYDASMLAPALDLGKTREMVAVVNPNDGPGAKKDPTFARFIADARKLPSVRVVGYIDLATWHGDNHSVRAAADVARERTLWMTLYGITERDGYWFDDAFKHDPKVRTLVQSMPLILAGRSFINPGEPVPTGHWLRKTGMVVCDFEDPPTSSNFPKASGPCMILFSADWRRWEGIAAKGGAKFLGFEDIAKHHNGEFQRPMKWWAELR